MTEARSWVDFENADLSVREQCRLLGIHRSSIYYEPQPETEENLQFMRLMDEEHLKQAFEQSTLSPIAAYQVATQSFFI